MIFFYILFLSYCLNAQCAELSSPSFNNHRKSQDFSAEKSYDCTILLPALMRDYFDIISKKNPYRTQSKYLVPSTTYPKSNACLNDYLDNFEDEVDKLFVQKKVIPPGSRCIIFGDLHGDLKALNGMLKDLVKRDILHAHNPFMVKDPRYYLAFLGDYVDRGQNGIEVLESLLTLHNNNPDNVILGRGNHEDMQVNESIGTFAQEIQRKFPRNYTLIKEVIRKFYESLPVALYLGSGTNPTYYALCCHGSHELGFDPRPLLEYPEDNAFCMLGILDRSKFHNKLEKIFQKKGKKLIQNEDILQVIHALRKPAHEIQMCDICFLWGDLIVGTDNKGIAHNERALCYGINAHKALLKLFSTCNHQIIVLFRAHQHSGYADDPMMLRISNNDELDNPENAGVGRMWPEKYQQPCPHCIMPQAAYTFPAPPLEKHFPNVDCAACAEVTVGKYWYLKTYRTEKKDL